MIDFADAILDSANFRRRHLLLGNGFSIACNAEIFHYGSLYAQADFSNAAELERVFAELDTFDFEKVINALQSAAIIVPSYIDDGGAAVAAMLRHSEDIKEILVQTISRRHPERPGDIADNRFRSCRVFLSNFIGQGRDGLVFTLNYDLLLYWALMHDAPHIRGPVTLNINDAFGNDDGNPDADYVVWHGETNSHGASVYFLHGALHLFDSGKDILKYTWVRAGLPLIDQVRDALERGRFPIFVAEGNSDQKKDKIRHNAYLYQALKQLANNVNHKSHCWFIFGHSLAENDDHILSILAGGKFPKMYVGFYGDEESADNRSIKQRALSYAALRKAEHPLEVIFYDAGSARVWG